MVCQYLVILISVIPFGRRLSGTCGWNGKGSDVLSKEKEVRTVGM